MYTLLFYKINNMFSYSNSIWARTNDGSIQFCSGTPIFGRESSGRRFTGFEIRFSRFMLITFSPWGNFFSTGKLSYIILYSYMCAIFKYILLNKNFNRTFSHKFYDKVQEIRVMFVNKIKTNVCTKWIKSCSKIDVVVWSCYIFGGLLTQKIVVFEQIKIKTF